MTTISKILNNIEQKVRLLTTQLEKLERENSILTEKNRELAEQNRTLQTFHIFDGRRLDAARFR